MNNTIEEVLLLYAQEAHEAARLTAEKEHMERLRTVILAEQIGAFSDAGASVAKAEAEGKRSTAYREHLAAQRDIDLAANIAVNKLEATRMRIEVWRTRTASQREAMRQSGGR